MQRIKKFVAIGPESTGKSTLTKQLAHHYNAGWCPEYARIFFENRSPKYEYHDLKKIAKGQLALEDEITSAQNISGKLFIDTDLQVIKVWSEFVFDQCDLYILDQIALRKYDGYFLCYPDLPWEADPLREYPDQQKREKLFCYYKDLLVTQSTPWCTVSGDNEQRMKYAISFVEKHR